MTAQEIVDWLYSFVPLLDKIKDHEKDFVRHHYQSDLTWSIASEYDFITIQFNRKDAEHEWMRLYCEVKLSWKDSSPSLLNVFIEKEGRTEGVTKLVTHFLAHGSHTEASKATSAEVQRHLTIADNIARAAAHCSTGDNYRPGAFSKVECAQHHITLEQINHMNAKSLNHKTNYMLRDLRFIIPTGNSFEPRRGDFTIARMQIDFSDRSSANNRHCGEKIQERIQYYLKEQINEA